MSGSSSSPQLTTVCVERPISTPTTINNGTAALVIFAVAGGEPATHPLSQELSRQGVNTGRDRPVCDRSQSAQIRAAAASAPRPARGRAAPRAPRRIVLIGANRRRRLRTELGCELLKRRDAILRRGMGGKQIVDAVARQRVDDEHVRGGGISFRLGVR